MTTAAEPALERTEAPQATAAGEKARSKKGIYAAAIGAAVLAVGGAYYVAHRGLESTDDAQTDADVVAVPVRISGIVSHIYFADNQQVKAGELLAEVDEAPAHARLAQAEATLAAAQASAEAADADSEVTATDAVGNKSVAQAGLRTASVGAASFVDQIKEGEAGVAAMEASLAQAKLDSERAKSLFANASISKAEFDKAQTSETVAESNYEAAKARLAAARESANQAQSRVVEASAKAKQTDNVGPIVRQSQAKAQEAHANAEVARAARDLAALDMSYTKIYAPHDGVISKRTVNEGQSVSVGQAIAQIVTPHVWLTANFKETQLGKMRVGQPVHAEIDAFSHTEISGDVESISGATGAKFSLLPPDNATGNYTKIVQRVPVRIRIRDMPAGLVLRPGMSADVTVDTR